jgi:hypothetical protein
MDLIPVSCVILYLSSFSSTASRIRTALSFQILDIFFYVWYHILNGGSAI